METKAFSESTIEQAEIVLKSFYMIGFEDADKDVGEDRFEEQMNYPRYEPYGDLSLYARQAILALQIASDKLSATGKYNCNEQIEYLEQQFILPTE